MKKIAILGCGQLGSIVADAIASGLLPDYTLCAAMSRKLPDAEALCAKAGGAACVTLDEVLTQKPDYVVETAAVQVAKESCLPVLEAGLEAEEPPEGALVVPEEPLEQPASRPTSIMATSKRDSSFFKLFPPNIIKYSKSTAGAWPSKYTKHNAGLPVFLPIFYKTLFNFTTENPAIFLKFMTSVKKSPRRKARGSQKQLSYIVQKLQKFLVNSGIGNNDV